VATGARKDKVAGQLACSKAEIGRYIVTQEQDLLLGFETRVGANDDADGEEKVLTAFFGLGFRPSPIVSVSCAGDSSDRIAVGCQSGAVLTLHAAEVRRE
jgi:hypothetical protein